MAWVIWITGLPGSGKSTIALALKKKIPEIVILNMDSFRKAVTPEPTYSEAERDLVYRAVVFTAQKLYELGHKVIIDATGNRRIWREKAGEEISNFYEIYLKTPLDVCIRRESERTDTHSAPRDIYSKGKSGSPVPGLTTAYEEPLNPALVFNTMTDSSQTICDEIISFLKKQQMI